MSDNQDNAERITVLSKDFTPAAMEFHRSHMASKGYRMEGSIVARRFQVTDGMSEPQDLFDGETYYAVTFVKGD
ncbi:MAG: AMP nucleosidase [Parvibaculales bacterium]